MAAVSAPDAAMTKIVLDHGGLPPDSLSYALESAKKDAHQDIVALLEQAGAKPYIEFKMDESQLGRYAGTYRPVAEPQPPICQGSLPSLWRADASQKALGISRSWRATRPRSGILERRGATLYVPSRRGKGGGGHLERGRQHGGLYQGGGQIDRATCVAAGGMA